jgi:hypothetical protein
MTQSTLELVQSTAITSVITTQFTSQLAQSTTQSSNDVDIDDLKQAAKSAADNTDQDLSQTTVALSLAQSGTLDSVNVAQSAFSQARTADTILNELELSNEVRKPNNVPIFIVHSLCI